MTFDILLELRITHAYLNFSDIHSSQDSRIIILYECTMVVKNLNLELGRLSNEK